MSTAKATTYKSISWKSVPVQRMIRKKVKTLGIRLTLDLTHKEASDILALCNCVGGCPRTSTRGAFDKIVSAFKTQKIRPSESCLKIWSDSITFK